MKFGDRIKSLVISQLTLNSSQNSHDQFTRFARQFYRSQRLQPALKVILGLIICFGTILMPAAIASAAGDINSGAGRNDIKSALPESGVKSNPEANK